jgi:hypothetical protein
VKRAIAVSDMERSQELLRALPTTSAAGSSSSPASRGNQLRYFKNLDGDLADE